MKIRRVFSYFLVLFLFILTGQTVNSEDYTQFYVQPVMPENQMSSDNQLFFDLRMKPSQEQTLTLHIVNDAPEERTFKVEVRQAFTTSEGQISYRVNHSEVDDISLDYRLDDMVTLPNKVVVPANSKRDLTFQLKMPDKEFSGQILGGINVTRELSDKEAHTGGTSNKVAYFVGMRLTENDVQLSRKLNFVKIITDELLKSKELIAVVQNPTMDGFGHIRTQVKITNTQTNEVVHEQNYPDEMQIAPNSVLPLTIKWGEELIKAGVYRLDLDFNDALGNKWAFSENFNVNQPSEQSKNQEVIEHPAKNLQLSKWIEFLITLGIILFVVLVCLLFKWKKNEKK